MYLYLFFELLLAIVCFLTIETMVWHFDYFWCFTLQMAEIGEMHWEVEVASKINRLFTPTLFIFVSSKVIKTHKTLWVRNYLSSFKINPFRIGVRRHSNNYQDRYDCVYTPPPPMLVKSIQILPAHHCIP